MLRKILTNEAASYYSGQGRKKKIPFVNLKLYDAVMSKYLRLLLLCGIATNYT